MDRRFKDYGPKDVFHVDKIDGLYSLDHSDILQLKLVFTWVGFPGWESIYSLADLNEQKLLNARMLHRIRNAIEDRTKPYTCIAVYTGDDFECPGPQYCENYHKEDMQNLLFLLETEICFKLDYHVLFNPVMHDLCN